MKEQKHLLPDRLAVYGGLGLLLVLGLCALLLRQDFSAWERRNLTGLPQSVSLTDWTLNDDLETCVLEVRDLIRKKQEEAAARDELLLRLKEELLMITKEDDEP